MTNGNQPERGTGTGVTEKDLGIDLELGTGNIIYNIDTDIERQF